MPGLLDGLPELCAALTSVIAAADQRQQQQQNRERLQQQGHRQRKRQNDFTELGCIMLLASVWLETLVTFAAAWPGGKGLLSKALSPAVPAAADLAAGILRCRTSSSTVPLPFNGLGCRSRIDTLTGITKVMRFATAVEDAMLGWFERHKDKVGMAPFPAGFSWHCHVWELLLFHLGLVVQGLHQNQKSQHATAAAGKSQQQQQWQQHRHAEQQEVPANHEQLLSVLGADHIIEMPSAMATTTDMQRLMLLLAVGLSSSVDPKVPLPNLTTSSSNSSRGSAGKVGDSVQCSQQQQQQQQPQPAVRHDLRTSVVPLLLVLLEGVLLEPNPGSIAAVVPAMHSVLRLHRFEDSCGGSGKVLQQLAEKVLPVVLQQLLPLLLLQPAGAEGAAGASSTRKQRPSNALVLLSKAVLHLSHSGGQTQECLR
jgi:hypothetical protein